jgi:prepilin peptidase CpaA
MSIDKEFVYSCSALACALAGASTDIKSRRIPNVLTASSFCLGIAMHLAFDGWQGTLSSLAAASIAGVIFFLFFIAGGMGGGDVKLMTAVACLAGLPNTANLLIFTSIAGGVMALGLALMRGALKRTLFNMIELVNHHRQEGLTPHPELNASNAATLRLPYGVAIAAGCLITLFTLQSRRL